MSQSDTERELETLLAEEPGAAAGRAARQLEWFDRERHQLVLYGAGTLGREVLKRVRQAGLEPVAFADDTPEKQGQVVDGLTIMTPREIVARFSAPVFVVTILNPLLCFLDAQKRLGELPGGRTISFLDLAWTFPKSFLPYYQFELPQDVLAKADNIRRAFQLWEDEESRRQFVAHLRFRLNLDYEALPQNSRDDYFPPDILTRLPDNTVFVDCGAYDGDTIRTFLAHQRGQFGSIYAFEPDEVNFGRLQDYANGLGPQQAGRVNLYNAGVGAARGQISFNATGNMSASFSAGGGALVDVVALQETVAPNGAPVFLKFDVEGAEWDALKGAEQLLQQARPLLAISVYHRPDDLWQLPLYIKSLDPGYRFFLRTQGEDGMDVICYAIPPQFPVAP
jgi:FkbM family methyltransferase